MAILVTGGAGYIGSHTCVELLKEGYNVVIVDNLSNSKAEVINKIEFITGRKVKFYNGDVRDETMLNKVFSENKIEGAIHFAGLKSVPVSVAKPLDYYENNILSTVSLCKVMTNYDVKTLVFSSSATVYSKNKTVPFHEDMPISANNPYGWTKVMNEQILSDLYTSDNEWKISLLRYFNPVGAHESALIGEEPNGKPNNIMPLLMYVACGKLEKFELCGNDYPTRDGTGVRDYIHITDLVKGHIAAMKFSKKGVAAYNLGTGSGVSVLEMINAFERVNNLKIPFLIKTRRSGDIAECYADVSKAKRELGWEAGLSLDDMCKSAWQFALKNFK